MQHSCNEIICSTKKDDNRSIHTDREKCLKYIKRKHQTAAWSIQYNSLCGWKPTQICWKEYGKILEAYMINWNECNRKVAFTFHIIAYYTVWIFPSGVWIFLYFKNWNSISTYVLLLSLYISYVYIHSFKMYLPPLLKPCLFSQWLMFDTCLYVKSFAIILLLPHSSFIIKMKTCLSQFS